MGKLTTAVNKLAEVRNDMKAALEEKGAVVGNAKLTAYPDIIRNIKTENPVTAIEIDDSGTWTVGSTNNLGLKSITPEDATIKASDVLNKGALSFSSSNDSIVKVKKNVASDGVVSWTAEVVGYGDASVTASLQGKTSSFNISNAAPANSLYGLQAALLAGNAASDFPVGHEFEDTYAGNSNPMIVAHYGTGVVNGETVEGVYLVRKYVEPTSQQFGGSVDYASSAIKNFLDTTYLNNCSEALKSVISNVSVQYYNGSSKTTVAGKLFLMSAYEVCNQGVGAASYEGVMWDYWKQKTGLSAPDAMYTNNNGRIMKDRNGTAQYVWLRSRNSSSNVCAVYPNGNVGYNGPSNSSGVLPACFVAKPQAS